MITTIAIAAILILFALLIGFSLGVSKGRRDVIKILRIPEGHIITGISYRKVE